MSAAAKFTSVASQYHPGDFYLSRSYHGMLLPPPPPPPPPPLLLLLLLMMVAPDGEY